MRELRVIRDAVLTNVGEVASQNREKICEAYAVVMKLASISCKEGLLALEYEAEPILNGVPLGGRVMEMLELLIDGTESETLAELFTLKFMAYNYVGIDALLYYLYARSVFFIHDLESSYLIEQFFNAVIPKEVLYFDEQRKIRDSWYGG